MKEEHIYVIMIILYMIICLVLLAFFGLCIADLVWPV
jgi:hypothetical protein